MLDPKRDEEERQQYEQEFERYKKAVEMCITAGFLKQEKFEEALRFVREFHS